MESSGSYWTTMDPLDVAVKTAAIPEITDQLLRDNTNENLPLRALSMLWCSYSYIFSRGEKVKKEKPAEPGSWFIWTTGFVVSAATLIGNVAAFPCSQTPEDVEEQRYAGGVALQHNEVFGAFGWASEVPGGFLMAVAESWVPAWAVAARAIGIHGQTSWGSASLAGSLSPWSTALGS